MSILRLFSIIIAGFFSLAAGYAQTYTIDAAVRHQKMDNFGASDSWTVQYTGLWPDEKRNAMADLLFSMETDAAGKPKGIGLSVWRFNIGAGSAAQGANSYIPSDYRRGECFQNLDGTYDWSKQVGQRWFLKAAKERGVEQFLAYSNSPPIQMTMNGLANNRFRPGDGTLNIKPDKYPAFADFLATVVDEVGKREGITFQYLAPFNEPEWNWSGNTSQEGTPALMSEIAKTVRYVDSELEKRQLDTKIIITESGQYDYLYGSNTNLPGRDNQIETFFSPASENYIGNLKHVPPIIVGHSYWTTYPVKAMLEKRQELKKALDKQNIGFWQTELCVMSNDEEIGAGRGKDLTMRTALYIARVIHHDLCVANAAAWHWWLAITNGDYKDGLIYATVDSDRKNGTFSDSKLLWALGNYSRFIRPGAVRLGVESKTDANDPVGLMVSSFLHEADKQLVTVIVNYSDEKKTIDLRTKNLRIKEFTPYITSDNPGNNLAPQKAVKYGNKITIPERSVVTLVAPL